MKKEILNIFLIFNLVMIFSLNNILAEQVLENSQSQVEPPKMPENTEKEKVEPPEKPGFPGGKNINPTTYSGVRTISSDENISGLKIESDDAGKNAILVNGGSSVINKIELVKKGNSNTEDADFYGTNAGVLVYNNGRLDIKGGTIITDGAHANAVFSYDTGEINISNTEIKTMKNNSGGVMVTSGGNLTANNLKVTTEGNSSAAIRSDRGGGNLTVNAGEYISNGVGSPAIYSTANITINKAKLLSTASEGAIVEGANSITLNKTTLVDNNNKLNGQSETYKNIFLYQSMSGDASEGIASFSANESLIETNKGDTIFVTNTKAKINLSANKIVNNDNEGAFLRIQKGKWGREGKNGGVVLLETDNQKLNGNIYVDDISELTMNLKNKSEYFGTINGSNSAKKMNLSLDKTSVLTLTGDSYLSSITDDFESYNNINLNGYTLYVDGRAITSTEYSEENILGENNEGVSEGANDTESFFKPGYKTIGILIIVMITGFLLFIYIRNKKIKKELEKYDIKINNF